ncbi:MAG: M28 family peptidase [Saprospiraceae bacterium]|nr:M28 family peptidase [Saprospiraceae bacterium]
MNPVLKYLFLLFLISSCKNDPLKNIPEFDQNQAYQAVKKQVEFGPRVPGTEAHSQCRAWFVSEFKKNGAEVIEQEFIAKTFDGKEHKAANIIASYNIQSKHRIIIAAHWDSRPFSDQELDSTKLKIPVLGADDGASGAGIIIELSRILNQKKLDKLGIDLILFDAEDYGDDNGAMESWCLGSQHWSRNHHIAGYRADYGILLDMVGAANPNFNKEEYSQYFAPKVIEKVWKLAKDLGYEKHFVNQAGVGLVDDHIFVNQIARIPMIDIINRPLGSKTNFVPHWHTQKDDMNAIDPKTLGMVGNVLTKLIYLEDADKI